MSTCLSSLRTFCLPNGKSNTNWTPKKSTNFDYIKAYVLAMVGNYDPLYKLYIEQECGKPLSGTWKCASPEAGPSSKNFHKLISVDSSYSG